MGKQTGLWDTTLHTDTEPLTKSELEFNARNLNDFDAVLLLTGGPLKMNDQRKTDFLSFIHDDGKGLVAVHNAAITWVDWLHEFVLPDEIYQMRSFSRDKGRVLLGLDPTKLDFNNPCVHRPDHDFAVTWARIYGKGRVFYSTLGHPEDNWDDPRMQHMYIGAIKWAMGLESADVTPLQAPANAGSPK